MTTDRRSLTRPTFFDIFIGLLVLTVQIAAHFRLEVATPLWPSVLFAIAGSAALVYRRVYPISILLTTICLLTAAAIIGDINGSFLAPSIVALFTVADQTDRRTTVISGIGTAIALYLITLAITPLAWDDGRNFSVLAWTALGAGVGDATRYRRNYVAAVEERARKAEAERDSEAARQVTEERLRIARELHDVLAHHIAVIHVHAGLAGATLATAPETSRESLGHITHAAADVLDELAALMQVLRHSDQPALRGHSGPTAPAPGLDRLDELVESYRRSGAQVVTTISGKPHRLAPAADLVAYRIVQEALTNAVKHGAPGTARLDMHYAGTTLEIVVTNALTSGAANGTGLGLVGMRERAASVNAELTVGPRKEQYVMTAAFDLSPGHS